MALTLEEKKEYLRSYRDAYLAAQDAADRLDVFRQRNMGLKAIALSDMPHGSRDIRDLSDQFARLDELENQLLAAITKYRAKAQAVADAIDCVEDAQHRRLLRLRYLDWWSFERIAVEMSYSYRQTIRAHRRAVESMNV